MEINWYVKVFLHLSIGMTPADGTPGQPYSDCYPVLLDGAMIGWVEREMASSVAESLRRFKVRNYVSLFCV